VLNKIYLKVQPLLIALQFLSSLPVGHLPMPKDKDIGASLNYYPLVGLILALLLSVLAYGLMQTFSSVLSAAILLAFWVYLTGALHIDGLADCADAWMGGLGSKDRTLALMKDPTSGPFAIVVLLLLLLIKFAAIEALLSQGQYWFFIWPLVFARLSAMILFAITPYARKSGLGKAISQYMNVNTVAAISVITVLISFMFLSWKIIPVLLIAGLGLLYLRSLMMDRIDGCTGDTAGALIEINEMLTLVTLAAMLGLAS